MRFPESILDDFAPAEVKGEALVHVKRFGCSEALCGHTIPNWTEPPWPKWLLSPHTAEITCPCCIKFCEEHKAVKITSRDAELIFHLAAFAEDQGQLDSEDLPMLRKLRDAHPEVAERYKYLFGGDKEAPMCRVYLVVKGTGKARTLVSIKPTVEQSVEDLLAQQPADEHFLTEYDFGVPNPHLPEHICQEVEERKSND
jgi:hypothetical protein